MALLLIDVDSMFASCEQAINPELQDKPVVVLSNNDGCVIAATRDLKLLGIKLGTPWFQIKRNPEFKDVIPCSANHELYANISEQLMNLLHENYEKVQQYSIDEAFIELPNFFNHANEAKNLRKLIKAKINLPVSIGIAKTKTLAKLASYTAKKDAKYQGVFDLFECETEELNQVLSNTNVKEIWGVGRKIYPKLQANNIFTAKELADSDPIWIRHKYSILLEQTVRELNNQACSSVENTSKNQHKSMLYSRLLARSTTDKKELEQIVGLFTTRLAEKLQQHNRYTNNITLILSTSRFSTNYVKHKKSTNFRIPTQDQIILVKKVKELLQQIYTYGIPYNRVLIFCRDLTSEQPNPLIPEPEINPKLKETLRQLQNKYGTHKINYGVSALPEITAWSTKKEYKNNN